MVCKKMLAMVPPCGRWKVKEVQSSGLPRAVNSRTALAKYLDMAIKVSMPDSLSISIAVLSFIFLLSLKRSR
jgi:hypothetical protein